MIGLSLSVLEAAVRPWRPGSTPPLDPPVAPVLTKTSDPGETPMSWLSVLTDILVGTDYIRCRWRVDGGPWTYETDHLFTSDDYLDGVDDTAAFAWVLFDAFDFADGVLVEVQEGVLRGGETAWSETLSDTMGAVVVADRVVSEGDSISDAGATAYNSLYDAAYSSLDFIQLAEGNSTLNGPAPSLADRKATALAATPEVISVLIGANDLTNTTLYPTTQDFVDALWAYTDSFRAIGTKVVVCTILPQPAGTNPNHNSRRATVNAAIKANIGVHLDQVADFDATIMGQDATASDLAYYDSVGVHPTELGHSILYPNYRGAMNAARGVANSVTPFTFADASGVTGGATSVSNAITIDGLAYGQTQPYSVTDGEVRKNGGAWGASSGTVVNGDMLDVRGVASGEAGGTVDVVLTVGTVSDTFTITTAGGAVPLTTTFRSSGAGNGGFGSSGTIGSVSFYSGRNLIMVMTALGGVPTGVTLGGTAGTKQADIVGTAGHAGRSTSLWEVDKADDGSGDLVITSPNVWAFGYGLWSTDATASFDAVRSKNYAYDDDPSRTPSIDLPDGGSILVALHSESSGSSIVPESGTTERAEFVDPGNWKFWVGERSATGQPGVTGLAYAGAQILAVSYQP